MGFLSSVSGEASNTARKTKRKQRRFETQQHNVARNRLKREQEVFMEDAERQKLILNERLAARGMSAGTHADAERALQQKAIDRGLADIKDRTKLEEIGADLTAYTHKTRNRMNPLKIVDFATELAESGLSLGMGMGGGGLGPTTGTSGLDQGFW